MMTAMGAYTFSGNVASQSFSDTMLETGYRNLNIKSYANNTEMFYLFQTRIALTRSGGVAARVNVLVSQVTYRGLCFLGGELEVRSPREVWGR